MLQLLYLDVGVNNITGTLPNSWSNMTQASTATLALLHTRAHLEGNAACLAFLC